MLRADMERLSQGAQIDSTPPRQTSQCECRAEETERIQRNRQFKAQGQARLEELIRDAKLGKKINQVTM